jgi:hypothetical protein
MQNWHAQSVTAPEKVRCLRNNTPNHTLTDLKARQSSKIREIGNALIAAGIVSLDAQAKALGLPRSTTWTILSAEHKGTGISARIICRMLNSEPLPPACSGENRGIREGKSSRYLRWNRDAASQIRLEAQIERPGRVPREAQLQSLAARSSALPLVFLKSGNIRSQVPAPDLEDRNIG